MQLHKLEADYEGCRDILFINCYTKTAHLILKKAQAANHIYIDEYNKGKLVSEVRTTPSITRSMFFGPV